MDEERTKWETNLVGVLDKNVSSLGLLHAKVDDVSNDTPSVGNRNVHLSSEVLGFVRLSSEDNVTGVVFGGRSSDVTVKKDERRKRGREE